MGLYAGFCALVQRDIKRFSPPLSQLGYMAAAFGLGMPGIALFHLMTHAFFKALMFLGSGSVIHACHHEQDIFNYGGLRKRMPITAITFLIGVLAISGVNFLSGYFSKDAILLGAYNFNLPVFIILYLGALLTAVYMFRLYLITFEGEARSHHSEEAKENNLLMTGPLVILAVLSVIGGYMPCFLLLTRVFVAGYRYGCPTPSPYVDGCLGIRARSYFLPFFLWEGRGGDPCPRRFLVL